jgi:putative redox protein
MSTQKLSFKGHNGDMLAAKLTLPETPTRTAAVFAHCFTCSKELLAARRICTELAASGIAVLSFDFTGLGHSKGEFSNTNFSSNVADLVLACEAVKKNQLEVQLLIGHSLGGAAVIKAAGLKQISSLKAVAVIGAPYDPSHVLDNFSSSLNEIKTQGSAAVTLGGRQFEIKQSFVDDIRQAQLEASLASMKQALLVLHAPLDAQVSIDNAANIFQAAKHPKSFVSLDDADHLLTRAVDADYAANVISAWAKRYLDFPVESATTPISEGLVKVIEVDSKGFKQDILADRHHIIADEPLSFGGTNQGLTPYQLLSSGLGACTNMTIRMYARLKKLPLTSVSVVIEHNKIHALDCNSELNKLGKIDQFVRRIELQGELSTQQRQKLLEIADKCPVHKTLEGKIDISTVLDDSQAL